jgi:rhodanese-related sulfurtransferase
MYIETLLNETMSFADVLREMDIEFIVAGEYGITVEDAVKLINKDHFLFLDVRTREKSAHLTFPFALHIPVNEIPDPDRGTAARQIYNYLLSVRLPCCHGLCLSTNTGL